MGRRTSSLIPVSVDARHYATFRMDQNRNEKFHRPVMGSLDVGRQERTKGGLGINVGLPKRLDRIFGEGGAGLRVSGFRKIMFSGRSQWTDAAQSPSFKQSKFPSLHMEQISRFDITGTIGSKITVKVSQDSQTDIPLANRLQIRYKGNEDDILKTIEAGNTNLSLPNTKFVGYSSRIRGLFGIKVEAKVGNLRLTGIASQEKGSSESARITPSGEESAKIIRDNEYVKRRIFDLGHESEFQLGDSVLRVIAYQARRESDIDAEVTAILARMVVDPSNPQNHSSENEEYLQSMEAGVELISNDEYDIKSYPQSRHHYMVFKSSRRDQSLGIYMEVLRSSSGSIEAVGDNVSDTAILKLIYSPKADTTYVTYDLMWRNCYTIGRGADILDFDIKFYKGPRGREDGTESVSDQSTEGLGTQSYLQILGLDQYDGNRNVPDGKLDNRSEVFRPDWGLLILPHRRPFDTDTTFLYENGGSSHVLEKRVPLIYDATATGQPIASEYFMRIFTKSRSSTIRLGKPNIIEGSEKITVNGRQLQKDIDYSINYDFGQITLLSEEATDVNADINIDFEYAPFMAVAKKTLLGMRAVYDMGRDFKIGTTILYKSDKAEDRKPRVGQETAKAVIYDIDTQVKLHPNFLTSALDALPFVSTTAPSNLSVSAELAQSHPNPNVDGVAYVDDFEASTEQLSIGTFRTQWQKSSIPFQLTDSATELSRLLWHNLIDPYRVDEIYAKKETGAGQGAVRGLRFIFRPNYLDTAWDSSLVDGSETEYEYTFSDDDIHDSSPDTTSWAGVTRSFGGRIDAERAQVFEFRARAPGDSGIMHIEFGRINEDIDDNGNAYFEREDETGVSEDFGLDGLPDNQEPRYNATTNPDPNHDNWFFLGDGICPPNCGQYTNESNWNDPINYEWLNGTEGNRIDGEHYEIADKEAFTNDFNTDDGYFSYWVDFGADSVRFRIDSSEHDPGDGHGSWFTYRIPINDPDLVDADGEYVQQVIINGSSEDATLQPDWNKISHIRIWFEGRPGQTTADTIEIADWYFVQSNWQDEIAYNDSDSTTKFIIASVSEEDGTFDAPSNVEAYTDPNTDIEESQRGLLLQFEDMDSRDTCLAVKNLVSIDGYSGYGTIEMYVHGRYLNPADDGKVWFIFRLGTDSVNFYQQRMRLYDGWDVRNFVNIKFDEITALKDSEQRQRTRSEWLDVDIYSDDADSTFRVRGNPNLNAIKYFAAGVVNSDQLNDVSGEIWLDELRVTDVRRDVGTAARISFSGNLADLGGYNFSYQTKDPYFRGLSTSTRGGSSRNLGSGQTQTSMSYSASVNLDKFMPRSWGAKIPVSVSYSKTTSTPLLRNGSDIVLPEEIRIEERSLGESQSLSVSPKFNRPGRNPLYSLLLNRLTTKFSYRRNTRSSVNQPYSFGESYNVQSRFDLSMRTVPKIPVFFWTKWIPFAKKTAGSQLGLYPKRWNVSGDYDRNLSVSRNISGDLQSDLKRTFNAKMDVQYEILENLISSLRLDTRRDLSDVENVDLSFKKLRLGLELRYSQSFGVTYNPKVFSFLGTNWSYKAQYSDDWDRSSESRRSSLTRSWSVSGTFDHIKFLGGKGSSSGRDRGRQRGRRARKTDVTVEKGKPFYDPPLAVLRFLTAWIQVPKYNYSENFKASVPGMDSRPRLEYRFGLVRGDHGVSTISQTRSPSSSQGKSYDLSSGFSLLSGIKTEVKFRRSINEDLIKQGNRSRNTSTSWPDLTIRISRFKTLPLIKNVVNKLIDVLSPRTGYSRSTKETFDLNGGFVTSSSEIISRNPLLQVNFKVFKGLSLSSSYALTKDIRRAFNPTSGKFQSESQSNRKTFGASTKYSFSAPSGFKLPIFGRVKFRSTMSISIDVKRNMSTTRSFSADGKEGRPTEKSEFRISPNISYTFSPKIRGGLSMQWSDNNSNGRKSHLREVKLSVEIRF
ncbi:MAG: cell surface protein SprA [candidate division Zixibacteria bacterium]|nr:cell surface protein SprA [candidate division Zixibacteria bacterium]